MTDKQLLTRFNAASGAEEAKIELLESADQRQALDLAAKNNLAAAIKANEVKDVLADINTNRGKCRQFSSCGMPWDAAPIVNRYSLSRLTCWL